MNFPLELNFKKVALNPQVKVSDASGQLMLEPQPTPGVKGLLSYASRAMMPDTV